MIMTTTTGFSCFSRGRPAAALMLAMAALYCAGCTDRDDGQLVTRVSVTGGQPEGIGIESAELVNMTNRMVADILSRPEFVNRKPVPKIIVDSKYFKNESSSRLNVNMLTDRLRTELVIAARGRLKFISREDLDIVESEKDVDAAYSRKPEERRASIADYRLSGRITSQSAMGINSGTQSRYHLFVFQLVDTKNGDIVWANKYEFKKAGRSDIVYR